jgi:hypothetical protein
MHRRKSSKEEDEDIVVGLNGSATGNGSIPEHPELLESTSPRRIRVNSTPLNPQNGHENHHPGLPPSAGPHKTSFGFPRSPNGMNGMNGHVPPSPFRSSFGGHMRNHSLSTTPYSAAPPSPLSFSFPRQNDSTAPHAPNGATPMTSSTSAPGAIGVVSESTTAAKQSRRHARIHSRNLSVFFPRPGSIPTSTIAEDGSQEIEMPSEDHAIDIPRAEPTPLGVGFKFGSQAPPSASAGLSPLPPPMSANSSSASRRGHHHKHSLSHNFFSFLEPGAPSPSTSPAEDLRSASIAPDSASGWDPATRSASETPPVLHAPPPMRIMPSAIVVSTAEFFLGAWIWIAGQQRGSLSSAGLGYWVVFDAIGVAVSKILPGYLASSEMQKKYRRPYGNARIETVSMFAQAIYLMFSAVYVIKETLEHVLLSADSTDAHHHHHGGESTSGSIDFPLFPISIALMSITLTASSFDNHVKLVNTTDNRIPSFKTYIQSFFSLSSIPPISYSPPPTSWPATILTNPYTACPLLFASAITLVAMIAPPSQQQFADMILAGVIAAVTFKVAYSASVILGAVLLQTSPRRGLSGGRMESFLRAMREVERHPLVLHLPAPHIWQLTPSSTNGSGGYIVNMELHVRADLGDDEVLRLTKWAWEKCEGSLKNNKREMWEGGDMDKTEVTVGVVRG